MGKEGRGRERGRKVVGRGTDDVEFRECISPCLSLPGSILDSAVSTSPLPPSRVRAPHACEFSQVGTARAPCHEIRYGIHWGHEDGQGQRPPFLMLGVSGNEPSLYPLSQIGLECSQIGHRQKTSF